MAKILIVHPNEYYQRQYSKIIKELGHEPVLIESKSAESYALAVNRTMGDIANGDFDCDVVLMYGYLGDDTYVMTGDKAAENLREWRDENHLVISISYNRRQKRDELTGIAMPLDDSTFFLMIYMMHIYHQWNLEEKRGL